MSLAELLPAIRALPMCERQELKRLLLEEMEARIPTPPEAMFSIPPGVADVGRPELTAEALATLKSHFGHLEGIDG